ncbi:MAG: molybdenum cofactor biosynthesis protein MoaE [Actinomycetota bacterium]
MDPGEVRTRVAVRAEPLDPGALIAEIGEPGAGAIVLFLGTARDHSPGKEGITHLEYEAYPETVEAKIAEVVAEAVARWPLRAVIVEHRVGKVAVGEPSVAVAVAAAHREGSFEAGRFLIDQLKASAPIWKKEHWAGGGEWVKGA